MIVFSMSAVNAVTQVQSTLLASTQCAIVRCFLAAAFFV